MFLKSVELRGGEDVDTFPKYHDKEKQMFSSRASYWSWSSASLNGPYKRWYRIRTVRFTLYLCFSSTYTKSFNKDKFIWQLELLHLNIDKPT